MAQKKKNERHEKKVKKEKGNPPTMNDMLRTKIPKNREAVFHVFHGDCQEQTNTTII